MAKNKKQSKNFITIGLVAENRKARYDYEILDTFEAGLALLGSEVKSLRKGKANITEAYAVPYDDGVYIENMHIGSYLNMPKEFSHKPKRRRKLLLHKKEINKIIGAYNKTSETVVPLKLYFNDRGLAKLLLGIGRGKEGKDKRETIKKREWERKKSSILKSYH
jgi:SsrA-binding protein